MRLGRIALVAAVVCGAVPTVQAHSLSPRAGDFYNGLAHPFIDPAQALLLVAVGLWAAQRGIARARTLLLGFPLLALLASWQPVIGVEPALTFLLLGALQCGVMLAWGRPPGTVPFLILALWPAMALGAVNGAELAAEPALAAHLYLPGAALGTFLLLSYVLYLGDRLLALPWGWVSVSVRVAGSWVAAFGLMMLALQWVN